MDEKSIFKRLKEGVINFDHDDIKEAAELAVGAGIEPQRVISEALIPGMDEVDKRYQRDEFFLPDLIMAGEAMNEATKILFRDYERYSEPDGVVVLATVRGDIHDIGKNILANLLIGSGVGVHDMGVDVESEEIIRAVESLNPSVLGLSSMLSTTRDEIKKVIQGIKNMAPTRDIKIIIGGASTSGFFARTLGADNYSKDAVGGVKIIKGWLDKKS
jgi:5-methyltetrahydrofolate--homocysteine methyltransferase